MNYIQQERKCQIFSQHLLGQRGTKLYYKFISRYIKSNKNATQ